VALDLLQALDVHVDGTSELTLNVVLFHFLTQRREFLFRELAQTLVLQRRRRHDSLGARRANTVHVRQRGFAALVVRDFNPGDASRAHLQITAALRSRLCVRLKRKPLVSRVFDWM